MTLTLELPPEVEGALANEARRKGTTPAQLVLEDLRRRYPAPAPRQDTQDKMTALFAQWEKEDPITGPEDAAARQREGDELMAALQANRFNLEGRTDFTQFRDDADSEKEITE